MIYKFIYIYIVSKPIRAVFVFTKAKCGVKMICFHTYVTTNVLDVRSAIDTTETHNVRITIGTMQIGK